jgi:hypothetical protein
MIYQGNEGGKIEHIIVREQSGLVVPEGDRAGLRGEFDRLYREREMVSRIGMLARRALEEKYYASFGLAEYRKGSAAAN